MNNARILFAAVLAAVALNAAAASAPPGYPSRGHPILRIAARLVKLWSAGMKKTPLPLRAAELSNRGDAPHSFP
jgi:hypothetical protein